ncbi:MAG: DUF2784 domain-containing protein [Bacteroidales bacterium]|jgi:hypothetical protein|nr:DUF2784 domain-containing protein [Bacteroidales bacterium]
MWWHLLDIFFIVFHTSLILFNVLGWIWRKTRFWNLLTLLLTGASWLLLGMIVGNPGYCPLTDWHFSVLERLGQTGLPSSYIKYLADRITGMDINPSLIDSLTLYVFIGSFIASAAINIIRPSRISLSR